jgi:TonB family protein
MGKMSVTSRSLLALVVSLTVPMLLGRHPVAAQHPTLEQLEAKVEQQYASIEDIFYNSPAKLTEPRDFRERLSMWQDKLAASFADAGKTIDEILKLNPPDPEKWRERSDTMWLYSQPVSPPSSRTVYGASEVTKKARLVDPPAAAYPETARKAKARGEVRLRVVLASDGTVKYIFPMKPLKHGLTEAAIEAASKLKFELAIRDGKPASQFATLSYEFKDGRGLTPYFP